jgi:thiosulfate dehydrogenase (quinone) large subunit
VNPVNPVEETSVFRSRQWLFAFARIYLGISFFFSDHGNAQPNEAAGFLKFALKNGYSWYQSLLNSVVVPHAAIFAKLVVVGEIYVGIALVIGFTTRLATSVALFLLVNYMCAKGAAPWGPGIDQSDIVLALIILFSDAGRTFGIDRYLAMRWPKFPL